eukprot:s619_g5.t1
MEMEQLLFPAIFVVEGVSLLLLILRLSKGVASGGPFWVSLLQQIDWRPRKDAEDVRLQRAVADRSMVVLFLVMSLYRCFIIQWQWSLGGTEAIKWKSYDVCLLVSIPACLIFLHCRWLASPRLLDARYLFFNGILLWVLAIDPCGYIDTNSLKLSLSRLILGVTTKHFALAVVGNTAFSAMVIYDVTLHKTPEQVNGLIGVEVTDLLLLLFTCFVVRWQLWANARMGINLHSSSVELSADFLGYFNPEDRKHVRDALSASACSTLPAMALNASLQDALGNAMKVELLHLRFERAGGESRYLVGIREYQDFSHFVAPLGETPTSSTGMGSKGVDQTGAPKGFPAADGWVWCGRQLYTQLSDDICCSACWRGIREPIGKQAVLHSSHTEDTDATDGRRYPFPHLSNLGAKGTTETHGRETRSGIGNVCWELFGLRHGMYRNGQLPFDKLRDGNVSSNTLFSDTIARESFLPEPVSAKKKAAAQNFDRGRYASVGKIAESILGRVGQLIGSCRWFQGSQKSPSLGCPWLECLVLLDYCMGKTAPQRFDGLVQLSSARILCHRIPAIMPVLTQVVARDLGFADPEQNSLYDISVDTTDGQPCLVAQVQQAINMTGNRPSPEIHFENLELCGSIKARVPKGLEFDEALEILVGTLGSWEEPFAVRVDSTSSRSESQLRRRRRGARTATPPFPKMVTSWPSMAQIHV